MPDILPDLHQELEKISNQLCTVVKGEFDFTIVNLTTDQGLQKLTMLINFVLDSARRSLMELNEKNKKLENEINRRQVLEKKNENLNSQLLIASRYAGMVDVTTSILHNIGNVLNSVNTSITVLDEKIKKSKLENLKKLSNLLQEHKNDLANFFAHDERAQHIPKYLEECVNVLNADQDFILNEVRGLDKSTQHVREIIIKQNAMSNVMDVIEEIDILNIMEDAIFLNKSMHERMNVEIIRDFDAIDKVTIDRVKLLQILTNVIKNAMESLQEHHVAKPQLVLSVKKHEDDHFMIKIKDNGIGISPENIKKIFSHGYTTKKSGHGFGLHNSAICVQEMGGELSAESEGLGSGASFILKLPSHPPRNARQG